MLIWYSFNLYICIFDLFIYKFFFQTFIHYFCTISNIFKQRRKKYNCYLLSRSVFMVIQQYIKSSHESVTHTMYLPHWTPRGYLSVINIFYLNIQAFNPTVLVHHSTYSLVKLSDQIGDFCLSFNTELGFLLDQFSKMMKVWAILIE